MGRRKESVNRVAVLPRGVTFFGDGRARPFCVRHRDLPREFFSTAEAGLKARILEAMGRSSWPDNATRDTFCTLHISAYRDPQRTALLLKHRNSQTLWRSYLGELVPPEVARPFFEGSGKKIAAAVDTKGNE